MPTDRPASAEARTRRAAVQRPPDAKRQRPSTQSAVTLSNYRDDPLYPRLVRATDEILKNGKVVKPIDVLAGMGLITTAQIENWRVGRVPYLERVIAGNLGRLSRLLRILRFHAHDLNLVPSITSYRRGRGSKSALRFTKTGDAKLEEVYATHFIWPGKRPFHEHIRENGT